MSKSQKVLIAIFEVFTIYVVFHNTNDVPLGTMAEILAALFVLVFLLPQIIGQFVLKPHPQNLYELYPKSLYFIAFVFASGIILSVSGITFDLKSLHFLNLSFSMHNISLFLFVNSIMLLVLHFNNILGNLSFNHNLKILKKRCISLIVLSQREDYGNWVQSLKENCRYAVRNLYELIGGDLQSHIERDLQFHIERDLQSHIEKIRNVIESLLTADKCYIPSCIKEIFEVFGSLLDNNKLRLYEVLLDDITKTSYVSGSYAMKKSTIDGLTKMNLKVVHGNDHTDNRNARNEIMKKSIKGIAQIGSSKPEFNHDTLVGEAQENLKRIFGECLNKGLDEFDYSVFVYSLEKLAKKAFENDIKEGIRKSIEILGYIAISFRDRELRINPTQNAIETSRDIGNQCAEKRWEDLLFNCFNTLLNLKRELSEDYYLILSSSALIIASYCNKYMPEVLPNVEHILKNEIDDLEKVKEYSLTYTKSYSQIQHSVLEEYLNKSQI